MDELFIKEAYGDDLSKPESNMSMKEVKSFNNSSDEAEIQKVGGSREDFNNVKEIDDDEIVIRGLSTNAIPDIDDGSAILTLRQKKRMILEELDLIADNESSNPEQLLHDLVRDFHDNNRWVDYQLDASSITNDQSDWQLFFQKLELCLSNLKTRCTKRDQDVTDFRTEHVSLRSKI